MSSQANLPVAKWLISLSEEEIFLNAISVFEIEYGLNLLPIGKKRTKLMNEFERIKAKYIIITFDDIAATSAAEYLAIKVAKGFNNLEPDMMIAGICTTYGAKLATRNVKDFEGLPIEVVNPWEAI